MGYWLNGKYYESDTKNNRESNKMNNTLNNINVLTPEYKEKLHGEKNYIFTFILALFFGGLGVHRFYTGKMYSGFLYLCTGGLLGIGVVVDLFLILIGQFKDSEGRELKTNSNIALIKLCFFILFIGYLLIHLLPFLNLFEDEKINSVINNIGIKEEIPLVNSENSEIVEKSFVEEHTKEVEYSVLDIPDIEETYPKDVSHIHISCENWVGTCGYIMDNRLYPNNIDNNLDYIDTEEFNLWLYKEHEDYFLSYNSCDLFDPATLKDVRKNAKDYWSLVFGLKIAKIDSENNIVYLEMSEDMKENIDVSNLISDEIGNREGMIAGYVNSNTCIIPEGDYLAEGQEVYANMIIRGDITGEHLEAYILEIHFE